MSEPRENTVIMRLMCGHLVTDDYVLKLVIDNERKCAKCKKPIGSVSEITIVCFVNETEPDAEASTPSSSPLPSPESVAEEDPA